MTSFGNSRNAFRRVLFTSTLLGASWFNPAFAQTDGSAPAPARYAVDENGVSVATGKQWSVQKVLSVGAGPTELSYYMSGGYSTGYDYDLRIYGTSVDGGIASAEYLAAGGKASKRFVRSGGVFTSQDGDGASLVLSGGTYVLTLADGTVYTYGYTGKATATVPLTRLSKIVYPDKREIKLQWLGTSYCQNVDTACNAAQETYLTRLQSVTSSDGYQLHYQYGRDDAPERVGQATAWTRLVRVDAINLAVDYCAPDQGTCAYSRTWPSVAVNLAFGTSTTTKTSTDLLNRTLKIVDGTDTDGTYTQYQRPGATSPNKTVRYDASLRVKSVNVEGLTYLYSFALSGGSMTMVRTNPDLTTRTIVSDVAIGLPTSVTDEAGNVTRYIYDTSGRLSYSVLPEGTMSGSTPSAGYTHYEYDTRGNITTTTMVPKAGANQGNLVTTAGFASTCSNSIYCNKPLWTKDALGNETDYVWDAVHGGITSVTMPADASGVRPQTRYSYAGVQAYFKNGTGAVVASGVTRYLQSGTSTCFAATSANPGNCVGSAAEVKSSISFGAQANGTPNNLLPVAVTQLSGDNLISATTTVAYDDVGNVVSVDGPTSGSDDKTVYRYDAVRQVAGIVGPDPDGIGARVPAAKRFSYNADGQVTLSEVGLVADQSDGAWAGFNSQQQYLSTYDSGGRLVQSQIAGGGTVFSLTQQSYDNTGRVICSVVRMDPSQWSSQSVPSDLSQWTSQSACTPQTVGSFGPDRVAKYTWDSLGRVTRVDRGYGTSAASFEQVHYTVDGKVDYVVDANLNRTTYEFDGFDRLVKTRYPVAGAGGNQSSDTDYEQLTYGDNVHVTQARLRDGATMAWIYDNLGRATSMSGSTIRTRTASYNLAGLPLTVSFADSGQSLSNGYDGLGRLKTQTSAQGGVSYAYDLAGRRTQISWPDGQLYVNYDYDNAGNIIAIRENGATSGVGVLARYNYDSLGHRIGATFGNGTTTNYALDSIGRLSGLQIDLAGTANDQIIGMVGGVGSPISYSPASQMTGVPRNNSVYDWANYYNTSRNYATNGLNQYTVSGAVSLGYDARGNLITSGTVTYQYNGLSQMTSVSGGAEATLTYDPAGRLYQLDSVGKTTRFLYDGVNAIAEYDGSNALLRRYVPGPGRDEPVVWYEGAGVSGRRWMHADERGSVVAVSDESGAAIAINAYDEYGIPQSGNLGRFQYTGQVWLGEIGLFYYKARMYSPTLGRFMQTDPIGYADGANWYSYVHGDPINSRDPSGMQTDGYYNQNLHLDEGPPIYVTGLREGSFRLDPGVPYERDFSTIANGIERDAGDAGNVIVVTGQRPAKSYIPITKKSKAYDWARPLTNPDNYFGCGSASAIVTGSVCITGGWDVYISVGVAISAPGFGGTVGFAPNGAKNYLAGWGFNAGPNVQYGSGLDGQNGVIMVSTSPSAGVSYGATPAEWGQMGAGALSAAYGAILAQTRGFTDGAYQAAGHPYDYEFSPN